MTRGIFTVICATIALSVHGATTSQVLELARNARADGIAAAAIHDLREAMETTTGADRRAIAVELARCLIESDREKDAIELLGAAEFAEDPDALFWLAQAEAKNGNAGKALGHYEKVAANKDYPGWVDAEYGRARMLDALGYSQRAVQAYESIPKDSRWHESAELGCAAILAERGRLDRAQKLLDVENGRSNRRDREFQRYLAGRVLLEKADFPGVAEQYDGFEPRNRKLAAGAVIGEADAAIQSGDPARGEKVIESFIWNNAKNPMLPELMAKLDEARGREKEPTNATLKRWENDHENVVLSSLATFYLARSNEREKRFDDAIRMYREFLSAHSTSPMRLEATVRLARLLLDRKSLEEAVRLLDGAEELAENKADRAALRYLSATANFEAGNYTIATKRFVDAANLDPDVSEAALSNAAIAAIRAGDEPLAAEVMNALFKEHPATAERVELAQAMQSALLGAPDAGYLLSSIAEENGTQGRAARVAAAEWKWLHGDPHGARFDFRRVANEKPASPEQEDYFAVYLADDGSAGALPQVAAAAQGFLADHPGSSREAEVRMKWGEVLARSGDEVGARAQFEQAAATADEPALAQEASFLAGRSAKRSMEPDQFVQAIELFEEVAKGGNKSLAEQARLEQASLRIGLKQPAEAVRLLDSLIDTTTNQRVRNAARLMKGETLLSMGGTNIAASRDVFRTVADDPASTANERNEALVKLAGACQAAEDFDASLSAYYEVLNAPRDKQPEYFWYYKAGFDAGRLLHERDRLKEEAAVYEKMAAVPGPRAGEAKEKVKLLRLGNFIWED